MYVHASASAHMCVGARVQAHRKNLDNIEQLISYTLLKICKPFQSSLLKLVKTMF